MNARMPVQSYVWDTMNPNTPDVALTPPSPLCCLRFNPKVRARQIKRIKRYRPRVRAWCHRLGPLRAARHCVCPPAGGGATSKLFLRIATRRGSAIFKPGRSWVRLFQVQTTEAWPIPPRLGPFNNPLFLESFLRR